MKASIIKLLPDDYHGSPHIASIFPPDEFPDIPDEDEVFSAWGEAGYNEYYWRTEDNDYDEEEDYLGGKYGEDTIFDKYANHPLYYSLYLVIYEEDSGLYNIVETLAIEIHDDEFKKEVGSPEKFAKWCMKQKGIEFCVPLK